MNRTQVTLALLLAVADAGCSGGGATIGAGGGPAPGAGGTPAPGRSGSPGSPGGTPSPTPSPAPSGCSAPAAAIRAIPASSFAWAPRVTESVAYRGPRPLLASRARSSLYTGTGPRPGPDILYAPVADAPQFHNTGIWSAPPILISGTSSYREFEYVYQGFLYDDGGAKQVADPNQTTTSPDYISKPSGTYTYPQNPVYAGNAANIVEFRMKPLADATAFRMTFNSMLDPTLVAFTIGLGSSAAAYAMPHGANTMQIAQIFATVHGNSIDVVDAATGRVLAASGCSSALSATSDTSTRQIDVRIPYSIFDPRGNPALRVSVASGLWDVQNGKYLVPQAASSVTAPGGAGNATAPSAFFDVGYRHSFDEGISNFRDSGQSAALAGGNIASFFDLVDMVKLASGIDDDMPGKPQGVTQTGAMDRILASHYALGQGVQFSNCNGFVAICGPEYLGNLQPYQIYVPTKAPPSSGYGLTLQLHALTGTYNQLANSKWQMQLAERGSGSIVLEPEARGPDDWYYNLGGADVFEAWADVAAHYQLDPSYNAIDGYSMGGYGSFKLSTSYPDLFARAHTLVGTVAAQTDYNGGTPITGEHTAIARMLPSLRNVPIMMFFAAQDELVTAPGTTQLQQSIDGLAYRYEWDLFNPADHFSITAFDIFDRDAAFLGDARVDPNPPHVTYAFNPVWSDPSHLFVNDHAYWLSNLTVRDSSAPVAGSPLGVIDVRSEGFGVTDPVASAETPVAGTVTSGIPTTYQGFTRTWASPAPAPVADLLDINATNIATVTIDPARAHVDCNAQLKVTSDGPVSITLGTCGSKAFARGRKTGQVR